MKGLRLYLTPFAPDQSGAVSVLYSLDGMIILLDAGGCTGNVLGFDEPRWQHHKAAVFSAGLRDMDAIMGRDKELTHKAAAAFAHSGCSFIALVGTPVPSIIGTDYRALTHMLANKCGCPVISIATNGMATAESGLEEAYLTLFRSFAEKRNDTTPSSPEEKSMRTAGVIGATPLELIDLSDMEVVRERLRSAGYGRVIFYGADATREDYERAGANAHNFVLSGSGIKAARYLQKTFGTPFTIGYPGIERYLPEELRADGCGKGKGKHSEILILHDPVPAAALKAELVCRGYCEDQIDTASFFAVKGLPEGMLTFAVKEESDLLKILAQRHYAKVFADPVIGKMPLGGAELIPLPEFAVSGKRILT
ncbi:MAG: nitrogenase component 1 [Lachnospiraceae bacterium]|nr:nitrogenase component 1 [Lachnospiraceae bacterium]